jgi:MFS family permease
MQRSRVGAPGPGTRTIPPFLPTNSGNPMAKNNRPPKPGHLKLGRHLILIDRVPPLSGLRPTMANRSEKDPAESTGSAGLGPGPEDDASPKIPPNPTPPPFVRDSHSQPYAYSIFSETEKRLIVYQTSFSGMFSGISSFIYYPAIRPLSEELGASIAAINLTVSAYLIVAGVFPSIFGDISDQSGRRVASLLAFALYVSANLGIGLQTNYAVLVVLRCIQSAGAAGTIAIAYGVIADLSIPAERGSYVGVLFGFTNAAPCLGPVIGGAITQWLSWRWIFFLLTIVSGVHLLGLVAFFPETSRKLAGNGAATNLPRWRWSVYQLLFGKHNAGVVTSRSATAPRSGIRIPNPLSCLAILLHRPTIAVIVVGSIQYATYSALGTSLATAMADVYSLNYLAAGLVYLPPGIGGLIAALFTGKLVDHNYRVVARSLPPSLSPAVVVAGGDAAAAAATAASTRNNPNDILNFPIEKARLRPVFAFLAISTCSMAGYGWSLEAQAHIAIPLVMQFLCGGAQVATFVNLSTLLTDFNVDRSSTAQASYSLVRCAVAAGVVAVLEPLLERVGVGWCFMVYAALGALCIPMLLVLWRYGWVWRKKEAQAAAETEARDLEV